MKYTFLCHGFVLSAFFYSHLQPAELNSLTTIKRIINKKKERAENAQIVLSNIAQMIGQIGNIIEEPHDAENVENAVTNIVNNIVKITINAIQNKSLTSKDASIIIRGLQEVCLNLDLPTLQAIELEELQQETNT